MQDWSLWAALSVPIYAAFTRTLKGRRAGAAGWAYSWGLAAFLSVYLWHFQQQWLAQWPPLVAQVRATGLPPLPDMATPHYETLWAGMAVVAVLLVVPVVRYWCERKKERVAG